MAAGKYVRFGLRADKNLADLPNQNTALGNVLDDLVVGVPFTPQDLKVIDDLQLTDVYATDLQELSEKEVTYRDFIFNIDGSVTIGNPVPVNPTITIKDRIVNRKVVFGDPPYQLGGSGPNCTILPSNAFNSNAYQTPVGTPPSLELITDLPVPNNEVQPVTGKDFWIDGRFAFANSFDPTFTDTFGGLSWEGYLAYPNERDLRINTNGFWMIEIDRGDDNNWELLEGVWYTDYTAICQLDTGVDALNLTVRVEDTLRIYVGMKVIIPGSPEDQEFIITQVDRLNGNIEILPDENTTDAGVNFTVGDNVQIGWSFGLDDIDQRDVLLPPMFKGDAKHYRFTSWWPTTTEMGLTRIQYRSKYVTWDANDTGRDDFMPYNYWYKEPQSPGSTDQFTYQYFKEQKIGPTKQQLDTIIENQKPIFVRYEPKTNIADISRYNNGNVPSTKRLKWNGDFSFSVLDPETDNVNPIQPGDFCIPFDVDESKPDLDGQVRFFKVLEKTDDTIFLDPNSTDINEVTAAVTYFEDTVGSGLIDFGVYSSIGLTFIGEQDAIGDAAQGAGQAMGYRIKHTLNKQQPFDVRDIGGDNLCIQLSKNGQANGEERFRRITNIDTVFLDPTAPPAGYDKGGDYVSFDTHPINTADDAVRIEDMPMLVYSHRGLNDNSIKSQCSGVYGKEVASYPQVNSGTQIIHLYDVEGISVGDVVQYPGRIVGYDPVSIAGGTSNTNTDGSQFARVAAINTTGSDNGDGEILPSIILEHGPSTYTYSSNDGSGITTNTVYNNIPQAFTLIFIKEGANSNDPIWSQNSGQHLKEGNNNIIDDKNYCILPLNTAPPFLGSSAGLSTSIQFPHLNINGDFECTGLEFKQMATQEVTDVPGYTQSTDAEAGGGLYVKQYNTNKDFWILFK